MKATLTEKLSLGDLQRPLECSICQLMTAKKRNLSAIGVGVSRSTAAPESTLKLLLLALGAGAVVLLPSLLYLLQIFKRQEQR
jgi:hypothetical protein